MAVHTTVARTCEVCGREFQARADSVKLGMGKYCGRDCWFESRKTRVMATCRKCGKDFETIPAKVRDPLRGKFCSQECRYAARSENRKPLAERFWAKVQKGGPDECWPWTGGTSLSGYGRIGRGGRDGADVQASRVAWELTNGSIPDGLFCLHICDCPGCCNPRHIFLGTNQDNMDDKVRKGRQNRGETSPVAKLTEDDVRAIRRRREEGISFAKLAREFGISVMQAHRIVNRVRWAHID